jgi:hypothetical protein
MNNNKKLMSNNKIVDLQTCNNMIMLKSFFIDLIGKFHFFSFQFFQKQIITSYTIYIIQCG